MSRLRSLFLSLLVWLFEGKPLQRRRIVHNHVLIQTLLWGAFVSPFVGAGLVFWLMANVPYFTLTAIILWAAVSILWAAWKVEIRRDTRDEVTEVDHSMIGM